MQRTRISIAGEVASPLHEGATLHGAGCHCIAADGTQYAGVRELRLRGDDAVGDCERNMLALPDVSDSLQDISISIRPMGCLL